MLENFNLGLILNTENLNDILLGRKIHSTAKYLSHLKIKSKFNILGILLINDIKEYGGNKTMNVHL